MDSIVIVFYDPNYGLLIEEALEETGIGYSIEKTSDTILEHDPMFCKTMIIATLELGALQELIMNRQLKVAGAFVMINNQCKYDSITLGVV